jgi:hypothetical protein
VTLALPIGLSFITFQAISYVVDVKRRLISPGSTLDFARYLSAPAGRDSQRAAHGGGTTGQSTLVRSGAQIGIPGDERRSRTERQGTGKLDRVVAEQPKPMRELAGPPGQALVGYHRPRQIAAPLSAQSRGPSGLPLSPLVTLAREKRGTARA